MDLELPCNFNHVASNFISSLFNAVANTRAGTNQEPGDSLANSPFGPVGNAATQFIVAEGVEAAFSTSQRDLARRVEDHLRGHLAEMTSDKPGSDFWNAPWRDLLIEHEIAFIEAMIVAFQVDRDYALGVMRDYRVSAQNGGNADTEKADNGTNAAAAPASATTSTPGSTNDGRISLNQGGEQ